MKTKCDMCGEDKEPHEIDDYHLIFNNLDICKACSNSINFKSLQELYKSKEFKEDFIQSEIMIEELKNDNFISESDYYRNANVSHLHQRVYRLLSRVQ